MDLYWRGGSAFADRRRTLPLGYPYWRLALRIFIPLHLLPIVLRSLVSQSVRLLFPSKATVEGGLASAQHKIIVKSMLETMRLRMSERERVIAMEAYERSAPAKPDSD